MKKGKKNTMDIFKQYSLNCHGRLLSLDVPRVMGILNVTPDSFYSGSRRQTDEQIAERINTILADGGSIIDVGACSTRPHAELVGEDEELRRLDRALTTVRQVAPDAIVSVDTFRPRVAKMCVNTFGVDILNDVSDDGRVNINAQAVGGIGEMSDVAADLNVGYILMSSGYDASEMLTDFSRRVAELHEKGVTDVIIDPGFGFGKTIEQSYVLMNNLDAFAAVDAPMLVALSRKSMIFKPTNGSSDTALAGTIALNMVALQKGASLIRVHDVREAADTITLFLQLKKAENSI